MKKTKKTKLNWSALAEGLGELIVMGIFFLIGAMIVGLFGYSIDDADMDGDLIILIGLIGLVIPLALFGSVAFCVTRIKKAIQKKIQKREKKSTMKIVSYQKDFGEYQFPEGFREQLVGLSVAEQMQFYRVTEIRVQSTDADWRERRAQKWFTKLDQSSDVDALVVDGDLVVGIIVNAYFDCKKPLLIGQKIGICTASNSDNNGAGYKERDWYCYLAAVSSHYYDEE